MMTIEETAERKHPTGTSERPEWAKEIAARRKALKLSQSALGKRLGASQTTVASWETGQNQPSLVTLRKIAAALETDIGALLLSSAETKSSSRYLKANIYLKPEPTEDAFNDYTQRMDIAMDMLEALVGDEQFYDEMENAGIDLGQIERSGLWKRLYYLIVRRFVNLVNTMPRSEAQAQAIKEVTDRFKFIVAQLPKEITGQR